MAIGNLILGQSTGSKSASTLVKTGPGGVIYIYPTASSTGIIALYDGLDATGTALTGSVTLTANTRYTVEMAFATGLFIQLVSGSATFYAVYV